jgi:lipopolysaccharide/colanic/teichoic acid biosynthesis glycosyltransferase
MVESLAMPEAVARRSRVTQHEVHVGLDLAATVTPHIMIRPDKSRLTVTRSWPFVKRSIDLIVASVALLLAWPLMCVIALLIRLDSPGPALFHQLRIGHRGRMFRLLKFRTMIKDAEQQLRDLEESNASTGGILFVLRDDPRVTRLGRFLRRYGLDDLPQLINVLRGDMSLVGPRPLQPRDGNRLAAANAELYSHRLQVKPGLTGSWQVGVRSKLDLERLLERDVEYVNNWSFLNDLIILLKSVNMIIFGRDSI